MNQNLILQFRKFTGWPESKVLNELKKVSCSYVDALHVYLAAGRMPNEVECILIRTTNFHTWLDQWLKRYNKKEDWINNAPKTFHQMNGKFSLN